MTSKKYSADTFRHTFSLSFMAALPVALINFVILFICTAGSLLADAPSGGKGSVTVFWNFQLDSESLLILLLDVSLLIGGVATALLIYKYMLGKASTNVFFSAPQTRGQMFLAKYLAGVCLTAAATFLPIFICGLINLIYFGSHHGLWTAAFYISLRLFAAMIFAFTVTAAVCCSVGSVAETIAYSAAFMILPIALKNTIEAMICTMLYGSPYTNVLLGSVNTWSGFGAGGSVNKSIVLPLGSFEKYLLPSIYSDISQVSYASNEERYTPVFRYVLIFLAVSAALACVAALLYKRRKAEKAGFLGANQFMTNLAVFSVSIFAASFISSLAGGKHYEAGAALKNYLIFVIVTVPVFFIVELFILRSFKRLLQKLWQLGVQLGIMALVALVFTGGLFGYSSRLPAADEIASVSVTTGTGDIIARPIGGRADAFVSYEDRLIDSALLYNLGSYYGSVNPMFTGITDSADIENVIKTHRLLIGCKGQTVTKQSMHADDGERLLPANIRISYKLKNGKELDRQYFVASDEALKTLAEITHGDTYKEYVASLFDGNEIVSEDGNVTNDYYFEGREIAIASPDLTSMTRAEDYTDTEQRRVLFAAVADDIRNDRLPLDLSSTEKLLGYIVFSMDPDGAVGYEMVDKKTSEEDSLLNGEFTAIPVYANMTSTLAVLEETSLTDAFESVKEPVRMTVCRFTAYNCSETFYFDDSSMQMFMGVLAQAHDTNEDIESGAVLKLPADAKAVTDKAVIDQYLGAVRMNYPLTYSGSYVRFEYEDGTLLYGYVPDRLLKK